MCVCVCVCVCVCLKSVHESRVQWLRHLPLCQSVFRTCLCQVVGGWRGASVSRRADEAHQHSHYWWRWVGQLHCTGRLKGFPPQQCRRQKGTILSLCANVAAKVYETLWSATKISKLTVFVVTSSLMIIMLLWPYGFMGVSIGWRGSDGDNCFSLNFLNSLCFSTAVLNYNDTTSESLYMHSMTDLRPLCRLV